MIDTLRTIGWLWLISGIAALASLQFAHMGSHSPVPTWVAPALTLPWSNLVPMLGVGPIAGMFLLLAGLIANCSIPFVIANIISGGGSR